MSVRMLLGPAFAALVAASAASSSSAEVLVERADSTSRFVVGAGASVLSFPGGALVPPLAAGHPTFAAVRDAYAEVGRRYSESGVVVARAWWGRLVAMPGRSDAAYAERLAAHLRDIRRSYATSGWRLLTFATERIALPEAVCRRYSGGAVRSSSPGNREGDATVRVEGRVCVFPARGLSLRWEYGERRPWTAAPLATFGDEAAAFLTSLRFD